MLRSRILVGIALSFVFTACNNAVETAAEELNQAMDTISTTTSEYNPELDEVVEKKYVLLEDYATLDTKTKLHEAFSQEAISEDTSWYAEGTVMLLSSKLTNPDNGHTIKFVWSEKDNESLSFLEVFYNIYDQDFMVVSTQVVKSECGIHTGMSLVDYETWNGAVIEFSGFGWDYGGAVRQNEGSKIAMCEAVVTLDFNYEKANFEDVSKVSGDMMISSDLPEVEAVKPYINSLTLYVEDVENF